MDINRRLIGVSAVLSPEGKVIDVDLETLVRRLLLFDTYILQSIRLQEFPLLAHRLGYEGLRDLLSANLIEIRCECLQLIQTAQSGIFGDPILPNFQYQFHWLDFHDRDKYVHDGLQELHNVPSLGHKNILRLKRSIAGAIRPLSKEVRPELFPLFKNEILNSPHLLKKSVELAIKNRLIQPPTFFLKMHQEFKEIFRAETDLAQRLSIDETQAHKFIESGLLGIAGLTQSIGEMKAFSALSGFREHELPLFRDKLDCLADAVSSQPREHHFQRVVEIANLPVFTSGTEINVELLMKIRQSPEAREFRDWLVNIGSATDNEIEKRVASFRALIGLKINSRTGQTVRFLTLSALSYIPAISPLTATALSALDQFVVSRLFPQSGVAAFVNELYPSIFEQPKDVQDSDHVRRVRQPGE